VECNVQIIKRLFKKAQDEGKDIEMALLEFRNTPITGIDESPTQLLMSRHLQSSLPRIPAMLKPCITEGVKERLEQRQQGQKFYYDKGTKLLPDLKPGDTDRYQTSHGSLQQWLANLTVQDHITFEPSKELYLGGIDIT